VPPHTPTYHYKSLYKHKVYDHRICFLWTACSACIVCLCSAFSLAIYTYTNENIGFMNVLLYIVVNVGAVIP